MQIQLPEGIVGKTSGINFKITDRRRDNRGKDINLSNKGLDVVLTSQPGILQARGLGELVGAPMQAGQSQRPIPDSPNQSAIQGVPLDIPKLDNLVIVIDTSSSMRDERLPLLKLLIKRLGPFIPSGTNVSLVSFNNTARAVTNSPTQINTPNDFEREILPKIYELETSRGTNIHQAFRTISTLIASSEIYNHTNPQRNIVLLITDGDHSPGTVNEYFQIFNLAQIVSPLRNATLINVGIGTDYNTEVIQATTGFAGGMWLHAPVSAVGKLSQNPFSAIIPRQLQQIRFNPWYLRCDMHDIERAWQVVPSINEIAYIAERVGIDSLQGFHEFRGGFWNDPAAIATYGSDENPRYWLAGQEDGRLSYGNPDERYTPDDFGKELERVDLKDLPLELREKAQDLIKRFLLLNTVEKKDLAALYALRKVGIIDQEQFETLQGIVRKASLRAEDEEESRSVSSALSAGSESPLELSKLESNIVEDSDPDFDRKLQDLGRVKVPREHKGINIPNFGPRSIIADRSFIGANDSLALHSGQLGRLDQPAKSIGPFQVPNVEGYDEAAPVEKVGEVGTSRSVNLTIEEFIPSGEPLISPKQIKLTDKSPLIIGRDPEQCNITISSISTSRRHCEIILEEGELKIRDLNSFNGTFINGVKITETTTLKPEDKIVVGNIVFRIKIN